jgi:hypothetical protein
LPDRPALHGADELGAGDDAVVGLSGDAAYLPDVPISAGAFEPLHVTGIEGTFLDAHYPRPVSGCAAEVSQRIAEAVFAALVQALPDRVTAAPAGTSGNFGLGGHDPEKGRDFVMYQISGGGYGGFAGGDGHRERLFHHRHIQGPAGRDHGADLSRDLYRRYAAARRVGRGGGVPRRASGWTMRSNCCAARRGPVS